MNLNYLIACILSLCFFSLNAQETLPIYQDYLSDNVFLVHPAAAGVGSCGKIRATARGQWLGVTDAPELQTLSFHTKWDAESKAGLGVVLFNDKNGYHSQKALQGTYAYHLSLDNSDVINQLSFGLSLAMVQNQTDQSSFTVVDPLVSQVVQSDSYFNSDFGIAYHLGGLSSYFTVKNLFLAAKNQLSSEYDALNMRNYILGVGYFFRDFRFVKLEPSLLFQYKEYTNEKVLDLNVKAYKQFEKAQLWLGLSYRQSFDGNVFQEAQYVSPILGVNYKRFMISYTYTKQLNDVVITSSGFHQFSLGYDLLCKKPRLSACPNINGSLF